MKRLRIAVTKGRLPEDSLDLFEKMGLDCTQVRADTRKLILPIANYPMDVVLSKAADVLTYVTHGVCDLGIVGKDTMMEHGGSYYEMLDLGYGKCRFALAVPQDSDFYGTYQNRVMHRNTPMSPRRILRKRAWMFR